MDFETAPPSPSSIFRAIPSRQCSRSEYDGTGLSAEQLRLPEQAGTGDGVSAVILTNHTQKETVAEYVAAGNPAQFADRRWADEMRKPVEVPELRPQLASFLGIGHRRPDLLIRIVRGPEMPRSLRRPGEQVLFR